jgi:hypothetical protein
MTKSSEWLAYTLFRAAVARDNPQFLVLTFFVLDTRDPVPREDVEDFVAAKGGAVVKQIQQSFLGLN